MNITKNNRKVVRYVCPQRIVVRPVKEDEKEDWRYLMNKYHYLGFKKTGGEQILYVAEVEDRCIALIGWSTGVFKNSSRDIWINWDNNLRIRRLKHIANNFRFLIFPWIMVKNLATRILSLNLSRLSSDWESKYGHNILLAETFVDMSKYFGTCYKAANWISLGDTSGYGRNNGKYYYHGKRKRIFIYPLKKDARTILSDTTGRISDSEELQLIDWRRMKLEGENGLFEALTKVPDPRKRRGRRHPLKLILSISVCAKLSGAKGYTQISEWAERLTEKQLKKFGAWRKEVPSLTCIREVLSKMDTEEFDKIIYGWLIKNNLEKGEGISIDGKTLKRSFDGDEKAVQLLSAITHDTEVVVAQKEVGSKTNEIPVLRELLEPMDIEGNIITADAMHTQAETARYIVKEKRSDYLFTVKDNQEKLRTELASLKYEAFSP